MCLALRLFTKVIKKATTEKKIYTKKVQNTLETKSFLVRISNVSLLLSFLVLGQRLVSWPVESLEFFGETRETEGADSEQPVQGHGSEDIEDNVSPEDAVVAPHVRIRNA